MLCASTSALLWGFLPILIKLTLVQVDLVAIVWVRFTIAFFCLVLFFSIKDPACLAIIRRPPLLLILAALGLTINYIGFVMGVYFTTPANSQIFVQLGPLLLAIAGIFLFKEKLSLRQFSGFLLAGIGFIVFYKDQINSMLGRENFYVTGVVWLIVASLCWAIYAVFQKILVRTHAPQQLNIVIYGLPVVLLLPLVRFTDLFECDILTWLLLLSLGLNTLVAYGCLAASLRFIEANKVSMIIILNPVITFLTMAILGFMKVNWIAPEIIRAYGIIGAFLVIVGALMVVVSGNSRL